MTHPHSSLATRLDVLVEDLHPARPRPLDLLPADEPPRTEPPLHRWRFSPGVRLLAFVATVALVIGALMGLALLVEPRLLRSWLPVRLAELVAVVAGFAVLMVVERRRPVELAPRRWTGLLWGLLLGAVLCSTVIGILAALGSYRILGFNAAYQFWPALVSTGLVASVAEELAFRGVLFRLTEDLFGTWAALAISALIFGLAHLGNPDATLWGAVAIALEAGLLFAALYAVTRSLWWTIGLHFAWNIVEGPVYGSVVSGSGGASGWFRAQFTGPTWLTGGSFGIEGSVLTAALLTAVGVWLLVVIKRRGLAVKPSWVRRRLLRDRTAQAGEPVEAGERTAHLVQPTTHPGDLTPTPGEPTPDGRDR
ncbi:MAG: CPBP family intramembrane metalloprotease [Actinobacteria bacterium]|nr:CPBP family intramembrane metalloprotease [Actinomycetota bacterium]